MEAAGEARGGPVFPVQQIPMLLFPPPPPPPLEPYASSSTSTPHHPSITSFPILVLTVLGILTTSVLLLTYYVFVIRCCLNWHSSSDVPGLISRRRGRRGAAGGPPVAAVRRAPAQARGLEESAIQALPAFRYRKAIKSAADSSECAVCLSEFQEEETVRLLPSCLHVFHVDCIDTWLQGSANCPLCRAAIAGSYHCHLPLVDQLPRPDEVVIQVVADTEEDSTQSQQQQQEAAESAGDATADQQVSSVTRKSIKPWHDVTSKGDECINVKRDRDVPPMRRSFSMDSLAGAEVHLQVQKILQNNTHVHGDGSDSSSSSSTLQGF